MKKFTLFLFWLITEREGSAAAKYQTKAGLLFFRARVLKVDLPWLGEAALVCVQRRLPVMLIQAEGRDASMR